MKIRICKSHSVKGLEKHVNPFLANGWKPHGDLIVTSNKEGKPVFYIQALKKK